MKKNTVIILGAFIIFLAAAIWQVFSITRRYNNASIDVPKKLIAAVFFTKSF